MIAVGRGSAKMPCESCAVQFSVFKRKRVCCECERYYCSGCLRRGGGAMCAPCRVLSTRPLYRNTITHLKVRDLQCFLQRQNVSTRGCVEKDELISLCVAHVNGASYRRRGSRSNSAFSSLKGLTNNINDFINNAFDLRSGSTPMPQPPQPQPCQCQTNNCFNSAHVHRPVPTPGSPPGHSGPIPQSRPQSERFTTTPGGERDISVAVPAGRSPSDGAPSVVLDSADCFEIEDLDDAGWEFVTRPADPLPNDSDTLLSTIDGAALRRDSQAEHPHAPAAPSAPAALSAPRHSANSSHLSTQSDFESIPDAQQSNARPTISQEYLTPGLSQARGAGAGGARAGAGGARAGAGGARVGAGGALGERAASELDLRSGASTASDTASLKDELLDHEPGSNPASPRRVTLEQVGSPRELEALSVKQLKELLARNRVEYRGCLERRDLLERAAMLWRDHATYRDEIDNLPISECCKICMAAPLECVLLECGHIAACTACSRQLAECPICRQYVVRAVRCFRS